MYHSKKSAAEEKLSFVIQVKDATNNNRKGPTSDELFALSFSSWNVDDCKTIIHIITQRLKDKGKDWRHVMKALIVIEYISLNGSDDFVKWAKSHVYVFKSLHTFQYIGESQLDRGHEVRTQAKALTSLLQNQKLLQSKRANVTNYSQGCSIFEKWQADQDYYNSLGS